MLTLKKPDPSEIEIQLMAKICCCNCSNEALTAIHSQDTDHAAHQFKLMGWRTYETSDEITGNTCPKCIIELQQLEQEGEL